MTARLYGKSMFTFKKQPSYLPKHLHHSASPPSMSENSLAPHAHRHLLLSVLDVGHSKRCAVVSRYFNLHFPDNVGWYLITCYLHIFIGQGCLFMFLAHFKIGCFIFFQSFKGSLYIFDNSLLHTSLLHILSPTLWLVLFFRYGLSQSTSF